MKTFYSVLGSPQVFPPLSTVVKYRKGDENSFIDKISKLSMHSIIKKSNRVSSHIKHLTGISLQVRFCFKQRFVSKLSRKAQTIVTKCFFLLTQVKSEEFDDAEKKFRLQERLIKSFIRDISLYQQHIRVGAYCHFNKTVLICSPAP